MTMGLTTFLIISAGCIVTMLLCRVVPLLALRGRSLPANVSKALNLIPPAAFAALVANDLLSPTMFADGVIKGLVPLISAALVAAVGYKTKSLVWCIVVGIAAYALLLLAIG